MDAKWVGFRELGYFKWWVTKIEWGVMKKKTKKNKQPLNFIETLQSSSQERDLKKTFTFDITKTWKLGGGDSEVYRVSITFFCRYVKRKCYEL